MIIFPIGQSGQNIIFQSSVINHFQAYVQNRWWHKEAGGQLFARFADQKIFVEKATGPRPSDRRGRTMYCPDKSAEQQEILAQHLTGLHYIGDWHTHPEIKPIPSKADMDSIAECVRRSTHYLNGFILVVVGTALPPEGLHVSIHDGQASFRLYSKPEHKAKFS
jgi:integrative and conjugative element protein (TIGR02256 family)